MVAMGVYKGHSYTPPGHLLLIRGIADPGKQQRERLAVAGRPLWLTREVELRGLEPLTSAMRTQRSPN